MLKRVYLTAFISFIIKLSVFSITYSLTNIAVNLPSGIVAFAMKLALAKGNLPREIMRSASGSKNLKAENNAIFVRDALAESRRLGIDLPRLESLDSFCSS